MRGAMRNDVLSQSESATTQDLWQSIALTTPASLSWCSRRGIASTHTNIVARRDGMERCKVGQKGMDASYQLHRFQRVEVAKCSPGSIDGQKAQIDGFEKPINPDVRIHHRLSDRAQGRCSSYVSIPPPLNSIESRHSTQM